MRTATTGLVCDFVFMTQIIRFSLPGFDTVRGLSFQHFVPGASAGLPHIRIVHGTGMGILRRTLREFLKNHPQVTGVTEPPHNQGGQGATEVELRQ